MVIFFVSVYVSKPTAMIDERLKALLEKYRSGQCTEGEIKEVIKWYESLGEDNNNVLPQNITDDWDNYLDDALAQIRLKAKEAKKKEKRRSRNWFKAAAILLLIISAGTITYYIIWNDFSHVQKLPAVVYNAIQPQQLTASRFVKLSDGSVVLLHAGSTLKVEDSSFSGKKREVTLNGEAYFDIHHMNNKPFIVHIGNVKVTVLGTAFNIREKGDSVAVTVTRGKVRVENRDRTLAILTPNQQVVCIQNTNEAKQETVDAAGKIKWMQSGLQFNNEPLDSIATQLEARYNVHIRFMNPQAGKCRVTVLEAFKGTETLDDILSFICPIVNANYKSVGNDIVITGPGC